MNRFNFNGEGYGSREEAEAAQKQYAKTNSFDYRANNARAQNADMASVGYDEAKYAELMASGRGLSQISDDELDFIRDRYSKSDISKRKAYTNSAADKFLSSAGLPSSKELNTYRQKYIDYMGNGGMEQYSQLLEKRGDNYYMTDTAEWIKNQWAKDNAEGLLGETVTSGGKDIKYEDTLLDEQLKANGFPPSAQLNEYYLKYKADQKAKQDKADRQKRVDAMYDEVMKLEDGGMDRQDAFDTVVQNPKYADLVEKGLVDYEELPSPTDNKYKNDTSSLDEDRTAVIKKNAKYDNMEDRISLQDYERHYAKRINEKKWAKYAEQQNKVESDFKSALVTPATTTEAKKQQYEAISKYLSNVRVTKDDGSLLTADDYSGYLGLLNAGVPSDVIDKAQKQGFSAYEDWNNTANGKDLNKWAETKAMLDGLTKDDGVYNNAVSLYRETHAATGLSNYSKDSKYDPSLYDAQISPEMSTSRSTAVTASGAIYNAVNGKGYGNVVGASESQRELLKDFTDKTLSDSSLIDLMSDDEKGTFNLIFKESAKRGLDYLQRLQPVLEQRRDNALFGKVMFASSKENAEDSAYKLNLSASIDEINGIKEGTSSYWKKEAWDRYSNYSDEALQRIIDDANEKLNSAPTQPLTVQMYDEEEANEYHDLIKNAQFVLDTRKQARDDASVTSSLYGYKEEDGKKATEEVEKLKAQDLPDELSRFINGKKVIQNDATDINTMASTDAFSAYVATSESRLSTEEQLFIDNMTEDQKNRYNWLLLHGEKGDAQKYFDYIRRGIDKKAAASVTAGFKEFGKENPFFASVGSVLAYPIGGMSAVLGSVDRLISGKEISDTDAALWDITGSLREGVQEHISDSFENEGFANTLNFLYNVGMSSADSFLGAVVSKATVPFAGELMLSSSAYASTLRAGLTRGLDREKAVQMAVASAAIEFVTEHMGIDNLVSGLENIAEKAAAKGSTSYMTNVLAQVGINFIPEALEEGVGHVAETMVDMMINGDSSELMEYYDSLIAKGMSKEEANKLMSNKFAKETAFEMLAGGLAGAESVGVGGTLNYGKVAAAHGVSAWANPESTRAWTGTHSKDFGKGKAIVDSVFGKEFSDSVQGYIDTAETVLDKRNINEISELLPQMRNTDSLYDYVFDEKGNVKLSNEESIALSAALNSAGAEANLDSIEQTYADFQAGKQSPRQRLSNTNSKYIKTSQELHDSRTKLDSLQKDVENAKRDYQGELDKANTALKDSEARLQAVNDKINAIESAIASRVGGDTTKLSSQLNALLSSQSALITEVNNHQNALNKITGEKKRNLDTLVSNSNSQIRDIQRSLDRHWASYSNLLATSTTKRSAYEAQYRFASMRVAEIGRQIDSFISSDSSYFTDSEKYLENMDALQTQLAEAQQEADFWDRKRNKTAPSKLSDAIAAAHSGTVKEFLDSTEPAKTTAPATANTANTAETENTPSNTAEQANQPSDAVKQENTAQGETAENATEEKKPKQAEEKKEEPEKTVEKKTYTISKTTQEKFDRIAKKFGLEIVWQTRDEIGGNGRYSSKEPNKIYLATDMIADKGLLKETVVAREFFTHEVVHYVANTQWYQRLSNLAEAWYRYSGEKEYGGGSGDDYFEFLIDEQIKQEKELHNRDFTREQAREELTAYFVQDVLFTDKNGTESLDWLTKMDGNAVQNFLSAVEYLIKRGKARRMKDGSAIKTLLLDAEHALGQAIRERKVLDAAGLSSSFSTEKKNTEQKNTEQTQQAAQNQKNAEENAEPAQPVAEQKNAEQPAEQAQPVAEEPKTEQFPNYWVAENDWNTAKKDIGSFDAYDTVMFVANNMGMEVGKELVNASDANAEDNGVYDKVDDIVSTLSESGVSPAAVATFLNTIYKDGGIDAIKNIPTGEGEANDAIVSAVKKIDSEHGSGMYSVGTTVSDLSQRFGDFLKGIRSLFSNKSSSVETESNEDWYEWYKKNYPESNQSESQASAVESNSLDNFVIDDEKYNELARRYKNGDASVIPELQSMVDSAARKSGYTKEVFHGTNAQFDSFDVDAMADVYNRQDFGASGLGIYLGDKETASGYGTTANGRMINAYIDNSRIAQADSHHITLQQLESAINELGISKDAILELTGKSSLEEYMKGRNDYDLIYALQEYMYTPSMLNTETRKKPSEILSIMQRTLNLDGVAVDNKNHTYDGIDPYWFRARKDETVLWDNRLIKYANLVTESNNGEIIPLSQRFNRESGDLRYSAGTTISDLASRFNPNVSGRAATLSGDDIAVPSTTEAIDKSAVLVNENGDPVMNVVNNGNGAMFSIGTYENGGRKAFEKYLNSRLKKKLIDNEQAEKLKSELERVYEFSKKYADSGEYVQFGNWSYMEVKKDPKGKPYLSVITPNNEYKMNLDFSLVCVKRRALDAVINEIVARGEMERIIFDEQAIARINEKIRSMNFETACQMCFVEAARYMQAEYADKFVDRYNKLVNSLGGEADYFNFGGNRTLETRAGIQHMSDSNLDFTEIDRVLDGYMQRKGITSLPKYRANKGLAYADTDEAIAYELKFNPESRRLLLRGDFMSSTGFDSLAMRSPSVLKLWNKKGQGAPKNQFSDMQYLNDIEKKSWDADKAYAVGGVRVQSFSDYVPTMFFDYVQMVADLAAGNLPAHAYTKELNFVKLFGLTGIKINMSLVPAIVDEVDKGVPAGLKYVRDENGNVVTDEKGEPLLTYAWAKESFGFDRKKNELDYDLIKRIQADEKYGKNCGSIAIGVSDEHILRMMEDPTIKMIIPYHSSGIPQIVAEMVKTNRFTDYQKDSLQHTRKRVDGKWVALSPKEEFQFNEVLHKNGDPKATVKEYLDWCEKNGYAPKFEKDEKSTKFKNNDGYYKVLEDFTLYDDNGNYIPQGAVQMKFAEKDDSKIFLDRDGNPIVGGVEALLKGSLKDPRMSMISDNVDELTDNVLSVLQKNDDNAMYSGGTTIADLDAEYQEALKENNTDWQAQLVNQAAVRNGYTTGAYHGSPIKDIDVFNTRSEETKKQKLQLLFGTHFTQSRDYAKLYSQKAKNSKGTSRMTFKEGKIYDVYLDLGKSLDLRTAKNHEQGSEMYSLYEDLPANIKRKIKDYAFTDNDEKYGVGKSGTRYVSPSTIEMALEQMSPKDATDFLVSHGYNSVLYDANYATPTSAYGRISRDPSIIMLDSNRIKSADPITYREDGSVIPLSERFNHDENSIRYSAGTTVNDLSQGFNPNQESALRTSVSIRDGVNKATGEPVNFIDLILDGQKKGETRNSKGLPVNKWVGIHKNGQVFGRVIFGEPIPITKNSPEYKDAYIEGTDFDIEDGQEKYYYPILDVEDFRDNPIPTAKGHNSPRYAMYSNGTTVEDLSSGFDDSKYMSLAERYKNGDTSVESELQDAVKRVASSSMKDSVVRENGALQIVYHGSLEAFNKFDKNKIRAIDYDAPFNGFWFTSDENDASPAMRSANHVRAFYLNIKNPAPFHVWKAVSREINDAWFKEHNSSAVRDGARSLNDELRYRLQDMKYDGVHFSGAYNFNEANVKEYNEKGETTFTDASGRKYDLRKSEYGDARLYPHGSWNEIMPYETAEDFFADNNNEYRNDDVWVAFEPEQIKSADPVTYDDNGNIIPLNKRFNEHNRDIRYSAGTTISDLSQGYTPRESINDVRKIFNQRNSRSFGVDDARYMALAERYKNGDKSVEAELRKMVDNAMDERIAEFNKLQDDADEKGFKYHRGSAPTKTFRRYAVFNVSDSGFRAAYAGNKNPTPVGVWLDAQNLKSFMSDKIKDDSGAFSTYIAGDTGKSWGEAFTPERYEEIMRENPEITKSTSWLLERGGKHSSDVPNFSQMNLHQDENGNKIDKNYKVDGALPHNKLIFEIEYGASDDGDLTDYVRENGRIIKGKNQGIPKIQPNQYYDFKTNPNAVGNWGLGGTFRIIRLVPYSEIVERTASYKEEEIQKANEAYKNGEIKKSDRNKRVEGAKAITLQKWVGGYHPEDFGLSVETVDEMFREGTQKKLTDLVTYDDNGDIIPLSERFDLSKDDSRYSNGTTMKDLIASYGKKKQSGLGMLNDVQTAERTSKTTRVSDVAQTVKEAPAQATQEWKDHVDDIVVEVLDENAVPVVKVGKDAGLVYRPMTMDEMNKLGDEYIARSGGVDQAMRDLARDIPNATVSDLTRLEAAAMRVIAEVSKTNNFNREDSAEFLAALGILNSNWGRMGKAMQLLNNSPLGRRKYMEKVIERINAENKKKFSKGAERLFHRNGVKEIVIPESKYRDLELATTPEEIRKAEFRISEEIGKQSPLSISDAIRNWRYFAMLANPVTHERNMLGNVGMLGMRMAKDAIAAGLENVAVKTGFMDAEDRTHYVNRAIPKEVSDFAVQLFADNAEQVQGQDRYGVRDKIHDAIKKSPIKLFDALMRFNGDMLEKEDSIFLRLTYVSAAKQYMMSKGLTNVNDLTAKQKAEIHQYAKQQAQEATYRDASALADTLNALAKKGGAWQFAIESTIPFKKTPINITKRGIEYSPVGLAKGVIDLAKYAINKGKNADGQYRIPASKIADELGKGLVGSALALIGAFLAKAGILKLKAGNGDRDEAYEKDLGHQDYSLEIGNMSIKIESLVPMTFPLFVGAAAMDALSSEEKKAFIPAMSEAMLSIADPIMDMSFMSSLNNTLNSYNKNKLLGIAQNAVSSYAGQFAPTVIGRLNSSLYPTRRTTKSSQKAKEGIGTENDYTLRSIASKTPFLNLALEPYVKTTGEYDVKDSFGDYLLAHFDAFLLPVNVQMIDTNPIKNEIVRLVESTGTVDFVPQNPQKYFKDGDTTYNLTAKEYTEYSKDHNETVYAMLKDVINSEEYQNAETDDDKANLLKKAYNKSHEVARKKWKAIIIERHSNN